VPPCRTNRSLAAPSAGLAENTGIAVGAAALQRHGQLAGRYGLALHIVRIDERLTHKGDAGFTVLRVPPIS